MDLATLCCLVTIQVLVIDRTWHQPELPLTELLLLLLLLVESTMLAFVMLRPAAYWRHRQAPTLQIFLFSAGWAAHLPQMPSWLQHGLTFLACVAACLCWLSGCGTQLPKRDAPCRWGLR